jgi:hypothetical protein
MLRNLSCEDVGRRPDSGGVVGHHHSDEPAAVRVDEPAVVPNHGDPARLVQDRDPGLIAYVAVELPWVEDVCQCEEEEARVARREMAGQVEERSLAARAPMEKPVDPGEIPGRCVLPGAVVRRLLDDVERNRLPVGRPEDVAAVDVGVVEAERAESGRDPRASCVDRAAAEPDLEIVRGPVVGVDEHAAEQRPDARVGGRLAAKHAEHLDRDPELERRGAHEPGPRVPRRASPRP